jgi:hypothetical protein
MELINKTCGLILLLFLGLSAGFSAAQEILPDTQTVSAEAGPPVFSGNGVLPEETNPDSPVKNMGGGGGGGPRLTGELGW